MTRVYASRKANRNCDLYGSVVFIVNLHCIKLSKCQCSYKLPFILYVHYIYWFVLMKKCRDTFFVHIFLLVLINSCISRCTAISVQQQIIWKRGIYKMYLHGVWSSGHVGGSTRASHELMNYVWSCLITKQSVARRIYSKQRIGLSWKAAHKACPGCDNILYFSFFWLRSTNTLGAAILWSVLI